MTEDEALRHYNGWIYSVVRKAQSKFPREEQADLLQDARIGFLKAWRSFDPALAEAADDAVMAWAFQRVHGEMSDGVRRRTGHRRRGFAGVGFLSIDAEYEDTEATIGDTLVSADDPAEETAVGEWGRMVLDSLSPEEHRLLFGSIRAMASERGVTDSAISQLRRTLHLRLRRKFLHDTAA